MIRFSELLFYYEENVLQFWGHSPSLKERKEK